MGGTGEGSEVFHEVDGLGEGGKGSGAEGEETGEDEEWRTGGSAHEEEGVKSGGIGY